MKKAPKSGVTVNGYAKDIMCFTKLVPEREKWIDSGSGKMDGTDKIAELAKQLHPGPIECEIASVTEEPGARTFRLKALPGYALPYFRAGQYVSIKFDIDGKMVTRTYGISSSPKEADEQGFIEITPKRKEGGYASDYIWKNWKVGTKLRCDGAYGNLFYQSTKDFPHIVALAGGSGITPFRAIARDMLDTGRPEKLTIIYGSRSRDDAIYRDELREMAKSSGGRIEVVNVLSEETVEGYAHGFITGELVKKIVGDPQNKTYYVSGPQAMYKFAHDALVSIGVKPTYIHDEAMGQSDDIRLHPDYPKEMADKKFALTLHYGITEVKLECNSSESILVALERQGYAVDSRCRSGECGWCRSQLESGEIWYRPECLAVRDADRIDGFIHVCSAYPMSDITLRVHNQL